MTTQPTAKRRPHAAIYVRVSTDEQVSGTSIEGQLAACLAKAEVLAAQVVGTFDDLGISGGFYATRPGLQSALALIDEGRADLLIVANISRLSRDTEHQAVILKRVRAAGGRIVFCDMDFGEAQTPESDLSMGVFGQFAQFERALIRSRTMKGHTKRAEAGIQPARNFSPYGFHIPTHGDALRGAHTAAEVGKYIVIEDRARYVREIFARCAAGHSLRAIARYLGEVGAPTPRHGAKWYATSVRNILQNPVYHGLGTFGRTETFTDERRKTERGFKRCSFVRKRDVEKWQTFAVPAIVDAALFEACQERLSGNKARLSGNPTRRYLLTGVGVCGNCGAALSGYRANKGDYAYHYYRCRVASTWKEEKPTDCTECAVRMSDLENLVLRGFLKIAAKPEILVSAIEAYRMERRRPAPTEADTARLDAELAALDRREKATISAQIAGISAGANPAMYTAEFEEIARQRAALMAQRETYAPKPEKAEAKPEKVADVMSHALAQLAEVMQADDYPVSKKHALLTQVIQKVVPHTAHKPGARTELNAVTIHLLSPRLPLPGLGFETGYNASAYCSQNFSMLPACFTFAA